MRPDVVIVGGGAAGCVLAARLSQDPRRRVLLLEAGPTHRHPLVTMPLGSLQLFGSARDWDYRTEPVPGCAGRRMTWTRGKMLGGSTGINTMIYVRGNRLDYDDWAAAGNAGWSWDDCLPYFQRVEDRHRPSGSWGRGGPVHVGDVSGLFPIGEAFVAACENAGIPRNDDFNGASQQGAGFFQVTAKDGRRVSAASAYLDPAIRRPNLEVRTGAPVARVLFEGSRAVGVELAAEGAPERIDCGAVILCGGAIASPQILQRSGVGPVAVLEAAGVPVLHERPGVGANLRDHLHVPVLHRCADRDATVDRFDLRSELRVARELLRWVLFKRGWGTVTGPEAGAFLRSDEGLDRPDVQLHFGAAYWKEPGPLERSDGPHFFSTAGLLRQRSSGRVTIRTADPAAPPVIEPAYLEHPDDVKALVWAVRTALRVHGSEPLARYDAGRRLPAPGVDDHEALERFVREHAQTIYHAVGTCRMGPTETDVVDARLRVRGLERLWVADTSVMPTLPSGNTMAPTYMVAEKGADLMAADV